jgi:hypothetical protein
LTFHQKKLVELSFGNICLLLASSSSSAAAAAAAALGDVEQLSIQSSAASSVHLFWSFSVNNNIIMRTHNPKRQERRRILLLGFEDHRRLSAHMSFKP